MSSISSENILLIGAGPMAASYHAVLRKMNLDFLVLGRGKESAQKFFTQTGTQPTTGSLNDQISDLEFKAKTAIVAVNAQYLSDVCKQLMEIGISKILVEKPAALDKEELEDLCSYQARYNTEIYIGYNRRFFSSVEKAREIIKTDGGLLSVKFDFSEPARRIAKLDKPQRELLTWFYGNSSHIVDLAFHFFGVPVTLEANKTGAISWHPNGAVFSGFAMNENKTHMSWTANWSSPGRWGVELLTLERRLILQPIEKLRVQSHENFNEIEIDINDSLDQEFKPGLYKQVEAFLQNNPDKKLPTLQTHQKFFKYYELVRTGGSLMPDRVSES